MTSTLAARTVRRRTTLRAWFHGFAAEFGKELLVLELQDERRRNPQAFAGIDAAWSNMQISSRGLLLHRAVVLLAPLQRAVVMADIAAGGTASADQLAETLRTTPNSIYVTRNSARTALREMVESLLPSTGLP